jgi:hypothetical protein
LCPHDHLALPGGALGGAPLPAQVKDVAGRFLDLMDASAPGLVRGLYLRGSLGFGEYIDGQSDVDFTAVLAGWPDDHQIDALAASHAAV